MTSPEQINPEVVKLLEDGYVETWIPKVGPDFENALKQLHEQGEVVALDSDPETKEARRVFFKKQVQK